MWATAPPWGRMLTNPELESDKNRKISPGFLNVSVILWAVDGEICKLLEVAH